MGAFSLLGEIWEIVFSRIHLAVPAAEVSQGNLAAPAGVGEQLVYAAA
jgi:hypothetical protein